MSINSPNQPIVRKAELTITGGGLVICDQH